MTPLQPAFAFEPAGERRTRKKRGTVRQTSVETHQALTGHFDERERIVLEWLREYIEYWQVPTYLDRFPTSAELAARRYELKVGFEAYVRNDGPPLELVMYVRRGLSDLAKKGAVETVPNGKRPCWQKHRTCETWRVRQR